MENIRIFDQIFLDLGIFLDSISGDFWSILGVIFGGFLEAFEKVFNTGLEDFGEVLFKDFHRIFSDRIFLQRHL